MKKEPVLIGGLINVAVAGAAAFGLDITAEQLAAVVGLVTTVVSFVQRSRVSPE
jgi:hypothetical protein